MCFDLTPILPVREEYFRILSVDFRPMSMRVSKVVKIDC
jgi:hypothetical protein